jgi:hypothetical protein
MGSTHRFIADPSEQSEALNWFRSLGEPPVETLSERGLVLSFPAYGTLSYGSGGGIDPRSSPIVTVFLPRVRRGQLWTVGEVHFLASNLRQQFPDLHKVNVVFGKWLAQHECVFSNRRPDNPYSYYLEGSVQNYDPPVYAFESGLQALKNGRYFVTDDDTEGRLDALCKALHLRGVECAAA